MTWGKIVAGALLGFSSTSLYYQRQNKNNIKAMIECEKAWQKYRSISKEKSNYKNDFSISKQLGQRVSFDWVNKELKKRGFDLDRKQVEDAVDEAFNHGIEIAKETIYQLVPYADYISKTIDKSNKALSGEKAEKERWKIYHQEVVPKCKKVRDWQKEIMKIKSDKKSKKDR